MVNARWYIVEDEDRIEGPYTAQVIRDMLREGQLDPFVLVVREGTEMRLPLVDADDIFYEASLFQPSTATRPMRKAAGAMSRTLSKTALMQQQPEDLVSTRTPRVFQALAIDQNKQQSAPAVDRQQEKQPVTPKSNYSSREYHVLDSRGQVFGPISAQQIEDLYRRNIIDRTALVERKGSPHRIPVRRFFEVIQKSLRDDLVAPYRAEAPVLRGGQDLFATRPRRAFPINEVIGIVIAAFVVLGVVYGAIQWREIRKRDALYAPQKIITQPRIEVTPPPAIIAAPPAELEQTMITPSKPQKATVNPFKRKQKNQTPKPTPAPRNQVAPSVRSTIYRPPAPQLTPRPIRQVPRAAATAVKPQSNRTNSGTGGWSPGARVTLVGYQWNRAEIASCIARCQVQARGPNGVVNLVFFKAGFGAKLYRATARTAVSGTLSKGGSGEWLMFVQSVN